MADNLFEGLPPPSANLFSPPSPSSSQHESPNIGATYKREHSPIPEPKPILKSALKRSNPTDSNSQAPKKSLKFKTTTDASEAQVIEAMQKISLHIKNPAKFGKASKLTIQLIQAGSVKSGTADYFFAILEAAMSSSTSCSDPSVRADYHALFSEAQNTTEHLNKKQKNQLTTWTINAVVANDLYTDDSFVFSKAAGQIKDAISNLPVATEDDDVEEAVSLKDSKHMLDGGQIERDRPLVATVEDNEREEAVSLKDNQHMLDSGQIERDMPIVATVEDNEGEESDPFGLDAFIPGSTKKGEKPKGKKEAAVKMRKEEEEEKEENKRYLKSKREALITCLEIAARRYKTPWCQTVIDILVKHASENVARFTARQRNAIEKLWASIREQQTRRKQGKSVTGKLDVNAFEWLQQKYATEKISIRHSVGGSGERRAQQWLG